MVKDHKLQFPIPAYPYSKHILTFGEKVGLSGAFTHDLEVGNSKKLNLEPFRENGLNHPTINRRTAHNCLTALFRDGFERYALSRGLLPYELSGGATFHWFKRDLIKEDKVFFTDAGGKRTWRQMVGFKSLSAKEGECRIRNWHFGIQARPHFWPFSGLAVRSHVAFTENGALYDSKARQHSARRNQCKSWYNDHWLDCVPPCGFWPADPADEFVVPFGQRKSFGQKAPMMLESPVSFKVVEVSQRRWRIQSTKKSRRAQNPMKREQREA